MEPLTLFTWGYWGWGSAPDKLVEAVDAVEGARGYAPPLFADIRISRSVRAPGFNGKAFEQRVGPSRYRWLDSLGNVAVAERAGPMRIKDPSAAETLLDIAEGAARDRQRILFFCSCEFPGVEGHETACHRSVVAGLVLEAATTRNKSVEIVEWPGGQPIELDLSVPTPDFEKLNRGAMNSMPLLEPVNLADMASVPWFSTAYVGRGEDEELSDEDAAKAPTFRCVTGPARYKRGGWYLPIYDDPAEGEEWEHHIAKLRARGFEPRLSKVPS